MIKKLQSATIWLDISAESLLHYYRQTASDIVTHSLDGRSIRFPASILRPFVTHSGVKGLFRLQYDSLGKLQSIERVSPDRASDPRI